MTAGISLIPGKTGAHGAPLWRLAIFSEVVSNGVRIGVSNFYTSLCERSCTRNVTLNSPPRDRSGKALFRKFRVGNKGLAITKFVENGVSGPISRLGGVAAPSINAAKPP